MPEVGNSSWDHDMKMTISCLQPERIPIFDFTTSSQSNWPLGTLTFLLTHTYTGYCMWHINHTRTLLPKCKNTDIHAENASHIHDTLRACRSDTLIKYLCARAARYRCGSMYTLASVANGYKAKRAVTICSNRHGSYNAYEITTW